MLLRLASDWPPMLGLLGALALATLVWQIYRSSIALQLEGYAKHALPLLRACAVFLIAFTLLQPTLESSFRVGTPTRIKFLVDTSESMTLTDAPSSNALDPLSSATEARTRSDRILQLLTHSDQGLIPRLLPEFDVQVIQTGTDRNIWSTTAGSAKLPPKNAILPTQSSNTTNLHEALVSPIDSGSANEILVLLSDGQHTTGPSPIAAAEQLKASATPLFTIGFGSNSETLDLAIIDTNSPDRIGKSDQFQGTILVRETLPLGTAYSASIQLAGRKLWEKQLVSEVLTERSVSFSFPASELVEASQQTQGNLKFSSLPVRMEAVVALTDAQVGEAILQNNRRSLFTTVSVQSSKLLLVDGRSRWETRYLKNMFQRDPTWEITTLLPDPATRNLVGFPDKQELFEFNCLIIGDITSAAFEKEQLEWIREYVNSGAGGLLLIDGARKHLHSPNYKPIQSLFPVEWPTKESSLPEMPYEANLTPGSISSDLVRLVTNDGLSNSANNIWSRLPKLDFVAPSIPLLGSEVLLQAVNEFQKFPLLVFRQFGAGKVIYAASDETWKWRYEVGDDVHSRVWSQIVRGIARLPLSVQTEFVDLDTGRPNYDLGESIMATCMLRDTAGQPANGKRVVVQIKSDGEVVREIEMQEDPIVSGRYTATVDELPAGNYKTQIRAEGYPATALDVRSQFSVEADSNRELVVTRQNQELLTLLATNTGGKYFDEAEAILLVDALKPLSTSQSVRSVFHLWHSAYWFLAAMGLLSAEWILRKRVGLI